MDLNGVTSFREARSRDELRLGPGEMLLGGGTWLFSEPQPGATGLVDLTGLGWPPYALMEDGRLRIAATCTVAQVLDAPWGHLGRLVRQCAEAFLMSFKIQRSATVGGNVCLALPAGSMISLTAALGGEVVVWTPDGGERREPVSTFVTGVRHTTLAPGEVLRAIDVPLVEGPVAFRRMALAPLGRSSAVVIGTREAVTVTAATTRPVVLDATAPDVTSIGCWYDDPHGPADWRRAVTTRLVAEVVAELGEVAA
jgi:CO/xanthine dehydrogenase FAD-binding subunit